MSSSSSSLSTTVTTRSASSSPANALGALIDASQFPLRSINDVVRFFHRSLTSPSSEPDLTLLSIVAGYVEVSLTTGEAASAAAAAAAADNAAQAAPHPSVALIAAGAGLTATATQEVIFDNSVPFPVITYDLVVGLYKKFQSILASIEKPKPGNRQATREIIKKVSDVVWNSLIRTTHKDRAHLQNLYTYLNGFKLDCFGVALAVVAGCQLLGYRDVRLAISEDHAWVVFGNKHVETIEVTWHGKGTEDKRGLDITAGVDSNSWLYLGGLAVVCDHHMAVAAICSAINYSLTTSTDCVEVCELQQRLLWLLYDLGHLKQYPMALGALGELEEAGPTRTGVSCEQLYREAVDSARVHYHNHHVYPYTFQGNYYHRLRKYREAFAAWANAAGVIRLYTYSCRDDEEIYKELVDIANEIIPSIMKTESSGHSARSILRDSEVFANLLRFYDGVCQWEENSLTSIVHIGWAKPLVNNITKFDYDIRSQVVIKLPEELEQIENNNNQHCRKDEKSELSPTLADITAACGEKILNPDFLLQGGGQLFADHKQQNLKRKHDGATKTDATTTEQEDKQSDGAADGISHETNGVDDPAKPRNSEADSVNSKPTVDTNSIAEQQAQSGSNDADRIASIASPAAASPQDGSVSSGTNTTPAPIASVIEEDPFEFMHKRPVITLYSQKMKGLKNLLLAEKLNTQAISLQLTAQSVASHKVRGIDKQSHHHTSMSAYATINVSSIGGGSGSGVVGAHSPNAAASAVPTSNNASPVTGNGDSIAASRPKRHRRE